MCKSSFGYNNFAYYYDILTQNVDYQKRSDYFSMLIENYKGSNTGNILLDLGCGTGTLLFLMEKKGFDVIGIDNSCSMLTVALDKKVEQESNAVFLCQEMCELDMFGTIDVAISALDSLNHIIDIKELEQVFAKVSLFLDKDGLFIFDVNTLYKHEQILSGSTFIYDFDEVYCVWQNSPLQDDNIIDITLDLFGVDEETELFERYEESFSERAYSHEQILSFIEKSGLTLIACYDEDSTMPPKEKSQRVVYITRK